VSKAAKRERQRQNREARREYEEALEKRRRFWRSARIFGIILIPIVALFAFLALRSNGDDSESSTTTTTVEGALPKPSGITIDPNKTYTATIETSVGTLELALDAENAPKSVNNFVYLARAGFYDGLLFNRAAKDFVVQTGSPENTTVGGPGYTIKVELPPNGYEIGSVAWAKGQAEPPGTAGSQFFIGTGSGVTSLDKVYGYIGAVKSGLDVAQQIMGYAPANGDGPPTTNVTMTKVTITES
jgi:cyclophilin family peptidyl-prolyl cis-trans isomerase